jgi:hypothetical protein
MPDRRRASPGGAWLRRRLPAASSFVSLFLWIPRAFADESPEPIHLRFEVEGALANQCPPQARFMELLHAELPRLTLAPDDARARTFDVRIRRGAPYLHGEVVVTSTGGASYTRSVDARDCATLTRAVPETPSQDDAPTAPHGGPPTGVPGPETNEKEAPAQAPVPSARGARRKTSPAAPAKGEPPVWMTGLGLGTELVTGSLPRSAMGYRAYVDVGRKLGRNVLGGRLSLAYAGASVPGPRLDVRVRTWTARLEGCISRQLFPVVSMEGCVAATSGSLEASSSESPSKTGQWDHEADLGPWLSFGGGARARWHLGPSVYSELFGNVSVPTTRFEAVSKDTSSIAHFAVSQVVGEVGLGLGFFFGGR